MERQLSFQRETNPAGPPTQIAEAGQEEPDLGKLYHLQMILPHEAVPETNPGVEGLCLNRHAPDGLVNASRPDATRDCGRPTLEVVQARIGHKDDLSFENLSRLRESASSEELGRDIAGKENSGGE